MNNVLIAGASAGQSGAVVETGTTAITGDFYAIQILSAANFSLFTADGDSGDAMTGFSIAAGITIFGRIRAFTLTSGSVRAYKR